MKEGYYKLGDNGLGYLLEKIPQDIYSEVGDVVSIIQTNFTNAKPVNNKLAGQINKEYETYLPNKATQYIRTTAEKYNRLNPNIINSISNTTTPLLSYDGLCWVNFQEKYEYNPVHNHTGAFSFVIWYKVPFSFEDEYKYGAGNKIDISNCSNGKFYFVYNEGSVIKNSSVPIDNKMEGYIAMFPSSLNHIVYPFYTSDDYRISMSGNIIMGSN